MSRKNSETGVRIINSFRDHKLDITRIDNRVIIALNAAAV